MSACAVLGGCDGAFDLVHVDRPDGGATPDDVPTLPEGLIAWFPMDAVTTRTDELVGGHHATCSTLACPTVTTGMSGGALAFDGKLQRLDVPPFAELETSSALTVSLWLRPDAFPPSTGYACPIVKLYTTVDSTWRICLNGGSSTLEMWLYSNSHHTAWPAIGTWMHVAGVWDGTLFALFVDGAMIGASNLSSVKFDGGRLVIGTGDAGGTVDPFAGGIDDVRIYNRPLSTTEIQLLYQAQ
jgi:hypothetical protein